MSDLVKKALLYRPEWVQTKKRFFYAQRFTYFLAWNGKKYLYAQLGNLLYENGSIY